MDLSLSGLVDWYATQRPSGENLPLDSVNGVRAKSNGFLSPKSGRTRRSVDVVPSTAIQDVTSIGRPVQRMVDTRTHQTRGAIPSRVRFHPIAAPTSRSLRDFPPPGARCDCLRAKRSPSLSSTSECQSAGYSPFGIEQPDVRVPCDRSRSTATARPSRDSRCNDHLTIVRPVPACRPHGQSGRARRAESLRLTHGRRWTRSTTRKTRCSRRVMACTSTFGATGKSSASTECDRDSGAVPTVRLAWRTARDRAA